MLPPNYLDGLESSIAGLYSQLEIEIIDAIVTRILNVGYANTVVYNSAIIAQEAGLLYTDIIQKVAKNTDRSYEEIEKIFTDAGVKAIENDDKIYFRNGLNPIPIKQDEKLLNFILATAKKTNKNFSNLTMTTATNSQVEFINRISQQSVMVSTGVKSYAQAIIDTIDDLSIKSPIVTYPSGHKTSIENATRMNILTGVNQTCGQLQLMRAEEMGCNLMEISAHGGARPEHAEWQGKIVDRSGKNKKYLSLDDIGYGEATGFQGVNCRHTWFPYYEGDVKTYSASDLRKINNEKVKYNGQLYSSYEASQIQRYYERNIRNDKKKMVALQSVLTSSTTDSELVEKTKMAFSKQSLIYNQHQNQLKDFIDQVSTKNIQERMYIGKFDRSVSGQARAVKNIANKYNNSGIIGSKVNGIEIKEIGEHIISRTYTRDVRFEDVQDTLKNPIKYGKIRKDDSQQIKGANCTIAINVKTGKLITVFPKKTKKKEG